MQRVLERLLNLLAFLLTSDRPVTSEEIRFTVAGYAQESDEAFRRMFERDKDLLRSMGIPIEVRPTDAWEVEFGYVLRPEDYQLPDPGLTDEERAALFLASQVVRVGGEPTGTGALIKLGGLHATTDGEPLRADLGAETGTLATAFQGAVERRVLAMTYRGRPRRVEPIGVLHQRGHWYLIAIESGDRRAYRLDRATDLRLEGSPGAFERPEGFELADALALEPWGVGTADVVARVVFDEDVAWWARRELHEVNVLRESGTLEVEIEVANPDAFLGWILGFEDKAEILSPPDLREKLLERVRG